MKWALRALLLNSSTHSMTYSVQPSLCLVREINFPWTASLSAEQTQHFASCGFICVPSPERTSPWWWRSSILCVGTCARRWTPGCRYDLPPRSAWCTAFDQSSEMKCLGLPLAWRWGGERKWIPSHLEKLWDKLIKTTIQTKIIKQLLEFINIYIISVSTFLS